MNFKKCSNPNCSNPARNKDGMLPATLDFFYKEKRSYSGLTSRCKYCCLKIIKEYREKNKEKVSLAKKRSYRKRKEYYKQKSRNYSKDPVNRQKIRRNKRKYERNRLKNDLEFRLIFNLRRRLRTALNGIRKTKTTKELICCSPEELRKHLEDQFQPGMSWDNYGRNGWHIDHIKPCAMFDLTDNKQRKECFYYKNLRPLWAKDNLIKGSRF